MKKLLFALLLLTSPISFAQEAKGVIEKIKICGTSLGINNWHRTLQFKVDGQWFGLWEIRCGGGVLIVSSGIAIAICRASVGLVEDYPG